jgi:hypothetical protein
VALPTEPEPYRKAMTVQRRVPISKGDYRRDIAEGHNGVLARREKALGVIFAVVTRHPCKVLKEASDYS